MITLATTDDYGDIRRFWYHVYCEIRGVLREKADHTAHELDDPLLTRAKAFVARNDAGAIEGTVLATYADGGDLGSYDPFYELDKLPAERRHIAIVTKLMTSPDKRGTGTAVALLKHATRQGVSDGIHFAVYDANPPTDNLFKKMGGVDWLGMKYHPDFGNVRVMMTRLKHDRSVLSAQGHPLSDCF